MIGIEIPIVLQKILFLGLVILCFIEEVLTRQDVAGIKDFAAINNLAALTAALKELHEIKDTPVFKEFAAIKDLAELAKNFAFQFEDIGEGEWTGTQFNCITKNETK